MNARELQLSNTIHQLRRNKRTNQQIADELGVPRALVARLSGSRKLYDAGRVVGPKPTSPFGAWRADGSGSPLTAA